MISKSTTKRYKKCLIYIPCIYRTGFCTSATIVAFFIIDDQLFRADDYVIDLTELADDFSVHGGGDKLLFEDFIAYLRGNESSETRTTLKDSLLSHKMSFAAEYSRLHGGIPVKIEE